jgi:hypothetical protein
MPSPSCKRVQDDRRSREFHGITDSLNLLSFRGPLGPRDLLFADGKADSSPLKRFGMTDFKIWLMADG